MNTNPAKKKTIDFGFSEVPLEEKVKKVKGVFDSVAAKYDVMNDVMSFGIHRLWKRHAIELSGIRPGNKVLDLAGGTGDLTKAFAKRVGKTGQVVLADINESMVRVGRDRLINEGVMGNVDYTITNAEALTYPDNTFDLVTISFGLRNVTNKDKALAEMARVLKPGGQLMVLEFSKVTQPLLAKAYDFYSFNILPKMGKLIANDEASYQYLAESIRMHPDQETLKQMMLDAGFDKADYLNMSQGIVALHRGWKY
ncbi:MAG: bifunctional demethylmenaquinone methyltransferase/2-methoxy-6-polyprenyl-1,4-benzoquinol methylase UbiE [Piscirickettsiaceae bacterium CG_4_9_14_3_um_filter_43_564]|nr:bifunctional demethylmenaquinone methyltransferase/2-methoxy-6-polyprenyl-1,4-benzoquinol methylase UbiE [Thiomicrospira sp.]PIQ06067.1 MAG: bifunctional demethylmenaquinone methyltransferase/2-methoxy-6-polyprenyl-1,4-benzoquinol methylase UbiE [Piscirickettsiaceae bacterium CG18_big_fil_WC_8_21_14_2_50_44_103]PIW57729.1 MAG: bifunctional demethylmenaquinone methyltransferase/2-methoxy-6-polyprenyl-1,4-benzoquinol methylase UbiE [Piscirickettsiaceae bacterium CG12_big_fil_rev_8_21_14_0_65_44_